MSFSKPKLHTPTPMNDQAPNSQRYQEWKCLGLLVFISQTIFSSPPSFSHPQAFPASVNFHSSHPITSLHEQQHQGQGRQSLHRWAGSRAHAEREFPVTLRDVVPSSGCPRQSSSLGLYRRACSGRRRNITGKHKLMPSTAMGYILFWRNPNKIPDPQRVSFHGLAGIRRQFTK